MPRKGNKSFHGILPLHRTAPARARVVPWGGNAGTQGMVAARGWPHPGVLAPGGCGFLGDGDIQGMLAPGGFWYPVDVDIWAMLVPEGMMVSRGCWHLGMLVPRVIFVPRGCWYPVDVGTQGMLAPGGCPKSVTVSSPWAELCSCSGNPKPSPSLGIAERSQHQTAAQGNGDILGMKLLK